MLKTLESKTFGSSILFQVMLLLEKDHFSILYIGGFGPHRGIDTPYTSYGANQGAET